MPLLTPPRFSTLRAARRSQPDRDATVSPSQLAADRNLTRALAVACNRDMRRSGTAQHSRRVGRLASDTALLLGYPEPDAERIRIAGLVHDVGKAWIPQGVLLKAGPLDASEWLLIAAHPITGAGMLAGAGLTDMASWVLCHHERPDGRGYPHGLLPADTPAEARILSVCDAFDAMTSARPNSPSMSGEAAVDELVAHSGTQFDTEVVTAFREVIAGCPDHVHRAA